MSQGSHRPRSRRELVADLLGTTLPAGEAELVGDLLAAEQLAVEVYGRAAASPDLSPRARRLVGRLRAQERVHAAALARLLPRAQREALGQEHSAGETEAGLARYGIEVTLGDLHSERAWFTLLENVEGALEGAYYKSLRHLESASVATLAARIMASEAQHSTLLLRLRNPRDIDLDVAVGLVKGRAGHH